MKREGRFPVLRLLGGALLVLAGVFAYFGVGFGSWGVLVFVAGGGVALAAVLLGHRFRPADMAIFVVGVLALAAVTAWYPTGISMTSYSATRDQVPSPEISLAVSSSGGSVSIAYTHDAGVAYEVNFTRQPWLTSFEPPGGDSVTNSTEGGAFTLTVDSTWSAVSITVGSGYVLSVDATTGTGSISMSVPSGETLGNVSLASSTGSVSADIGSATVESLRMQASTGSVSLAANGLRAAGPSTVVSLSTSTGSVSATLSLPPEDAVSLTASTSMGSISHTLHGFVVTHETASSLQATAGDVSMAAESFAVSATASLGSVDLNIGFG